MVITKIWEKIGWSKLKNDKIALVDYYSPSNDYVYSSAFVAIENNGNMEIFSYESNASKDALVGCMSKAYPQVNFGELEEVVKWLLKR